jgi:hypothetical protein
MEDLHLSGKSAPDHFVSLFIDHACWRSDRSGNCVKNHFRGNGSIFLLFYFYSYCLCITANCMLDQSAAARYEPAVISKRMTTGRHSSYHVTLEPWGEMKEPEEVRIRKTDFPLVQVGDKVTVFQKPGFMSMPWIIIVFEWHRTSLQSPGAQTTARHLLFLFPHLNIKSRVTGRPLTSPVIVLFKA